VLQVVEHEEHLALPQVVVEGVAERLPRELSEAQRAGDGRDHQLGLGERGEGDEDRTVGEIGGRLNRGLDSEAGLADAAGPGDGEQASAPPQQVPQRRQLLLPPDEIGGHRR